MADSRRPCAVPKPGFFHLDLFIKDTKDVTQWYDELKAKLAQETGPMESAMTNLLSVFAFYKLLGQGEARKLLEELTKTDENNLNGIANKQFIYGHLMRANDEMACRDRLQELLSDESDTARARNARCFAEQGYAVAFDVRDDSKDMVSKIRHAISLFKTALSLVSDTDAVTSEERLVWKFYLSKCYWRLNQVSKQGHKEAPLTQDDRLSGLLEAQKLLIEVTKMDPHWKHGKFYVARAWTQLGTLESKCRKTSKMYKTPNYLMKEIPQAQESRFGLPLGCYKRALEINPDDSQTYGRLGQLYLHENLYENAREMLDKSINIMPESTCNWFAYYIRSCINLNQYDNMAKRCRGNEGPFPSKQLLLKAKEDARVSCEGAATPFNIYHVGKVCQRLATHPVTNEAEDRRELNDALDYFAQALQLQDGYTDPQIHAARGRSLEVAGEHEKAAESYKRAVENSAATFYWTVYGVLRNLLILHGLEDPPREHHIAEVAFWINEGYKKFTDIRPAVRKNVFKFEGPMIQVCQYLIDHDNFQPAKICLECFQQHRRYELYRMDVESMMSNIPEVDSDNGASRLDDASSSQSERETPSVKLPVAVEKPRHGREFQYDFFVSHSSKDADWVNYALLPALEVDLRFKGCVADRDFVPGKSVFDNIIYSIENSFKTLLILTPNFVTSEWCKYETQQALMESLKGKSGRVIPIMLHKCDVPPSVRTITYLDVSRDAIGSYDWLKLRKALEETPQV